MSRRDDYVRKFDEKTRTWLVWPRRSAAVSVGEPSRKPNPKRADLDEIFGRRVRKTTTRDEEV